MRFVLALLLGLLADLAKAESQNASFVDIEGELSSPCALYGSMYSSARPLQTASR
jgi:hypothetical protein